jgi:hypothetical protein
MNKRLPQIFVSHSKNDKDIRSSFDTIFVVLDLLRHVKISFYERVSK